MKEALYYDKLDNGKIRCVLCPKGCVVSANKFGVCGVRENIEGTFYSLVYEKPIAIHIDPIEKKPLYHFHPGVKILSIGTYGCNLDCKFCQNFDISQEFEAEDLRTISNVEPRWVVDYCKKSGLKFVAFTYNEPTVFYEYMLEVARLCKVNGILTVVVSNGQINEKPLRELINYIDAFNIDLKSFNTRFYKEICGGDIETTKNTLRIIVEKKKHLEITFLLIQGYNDDIKEFDDLCRFVKSLDEKIVLHISRSYPRYKMEFEPTPHELLKNFGRIARGHLKNVYLGNI